MRIGIDISSIIYETGVSNYTRNLVRALVESDNKNSYCLFGSSLRRKKEIDDFIRSLDSVEGKTYNIPPYVLSFLWNNLHLLYIEKLIGKVDVFHSSDWTQPPSVAYKITTIHDLIPIRFPKMSDPKIVETHKRRLMWVKKEVDKIISVSEFTKREIVELLQIDPEKIVVIPEAADREIKRVIDEDIEKVKEKFGIKNRFLLAIGADPRKNIPNLCSAFDKIRKNSDVQNLVIAGRQWGEIQGTAGVIFTGHVGKQDLCALYSGAEALTYVSTYEGFGLPILEAMQVECPVVTSNVSSMPEVAGGAAVLVNPYDIDSIEKGIKKALKDRNDWIKKGKERVKSFSWEKTAKETLSIYKDK